MASTFTAQDAGVNSACGGRVLRVDVGMSAGCGGGDVEVVEVLGDGQQVRGHWGGRRWEDGGGDGEGRGERWEGGRGMLYMNG